MKWKFEESDFQDDANYERRKKLEKLEGQVATLTEALRWIAGEDDTKPYVTYYERTLDDGTEVQTYAEVARAALEKVEGK